MTDDDTPPTIEPTLRTVAMPADTNPAGDIFGGWLLAQMDLAGGLAAMRESRGRVATVAMDAMSFKRPVKVGDEVTVWAELLSVGTTSLRYRVSAWRRPRHSEGHIKVTEAIFTFVALDERGGKRVIGR
ncbi:acyl-CoA thioesterase [Elioraea sp.]|uniref:acyl-CoA thioesterase n=1 Tax=Elioraea sp. TaxID=2185103 RepID=UPI003F71390B